MRALAHGKRTRRIWILGMVLLLVGCGGTRVPQQAPIQLSPEAQFQALEERMLNAKTLSMNFHVLSEGVVSTDLLGGLEIHAGGLTKLHCSGMFGERHVDLLLSTDDDGNLLLGKDSNPIVLPRPPHLEEALIIGLTRMGILHSLAQMGGQNPPDHSDGGVREWAVVSSIAQDPVNPAALSFDLVVGGQPAGQVSLELDSRGRPTVRNQLAHFIVGEMTLVEEYTGVLIEP